MKSNVVFDKMYFVFKSNIGFIDNDILDDEIKCLTFQAWEGRGGGEEKEAGEEEDLSGGQGSQLHSMGQVCQYVCQYKAKVHNLAKKNLLSHTVWVTLAASQRQRANIDQQTMWMMEIIKLNTIERQKKIRTQIISIEED